MKRRLLLALLLVMPVMLYAQKEGQALVDSLLKVVSNAKEDTNKVKAESRLTYEYAYIDPDQGIKYGLNALALARQLKYDRGLENIYSALGINYFQKSNYPKGLEYLLLCLKIAEEKGNKMDIELRLYNISSAYFNIKDYAKALDYSTRSLSISEYLKDTGMIASNLSNMGAVYDIQGDRVKALEYLFNSLKMFGKRKDKQFIASTTEHISNTYFDLKNFEQAIVYGDKALKIFEEIGDTTGMSLVLQSMGSGYLTMAKDTLHNRNDGYNNKYLQKAILYMERSRKICQQDQLLDELSGLDTNLSVAYALLGNYKDAFTAYKEFVTIKDSVYSNDSKVKLANLETQREEQLKDKQIKINKLEKVFFSVGIVLLLTIILAMVRIFMIQKKAGRVKDVLMKEIHHRVKNNLQVISALLDMQFTNITDEYAKNAMTESNTRIRSISLIHQQLYQNENVNSIEFSKFARDLMHQVASVFNKSGQKIALRNNIPETLLDIDTAVPLGLILNELMTNSYKYAFTNTSEGNMDITLKRNGHYQLIYKDSGPGLTGDTDLPNVKGLGMRVMRSLSKQIGGTFTYNKEDKSFVITFKDVSGRKLTD